MLSIYGGLRNAIVVDDSRAGGTARAGPHKRPVNIHVEAASVDDMQMSAEIVYVRACVRRAYLCSARRAACRPRFHGRRCHLSIYHRTSATRANVPAPNSRREDSRFKPGGRKIPLSQWVDE